MTTFGKKLKQSRLEANLTLEELANKVGTTKSAISRYENDLRMPNGDFIKKVSDILNVSSDYLLGSTHIKNKPDDLIKEEYHKDFEDVDEALKFILEDNTVMAFGGFDTNKLTDDEIIEFANALKNQIELLGLKYKR